MPQQTTDLPLDTYGPAPASSAQGQDLPLNAYGPLPTTAEDFTASKTSQMAPETWKDRAYEALTTTLGSDVNAIKNVPVDLYKTARSSYLNALAEQGSYIKNFSKEHASYDAGEVTPQEQEALKTILGKNSLGLTWGNLYKMTPEQRQKLDDATLRAEGLDAAAERERVQASQSGTLDPTKFDPTGALLSGGGLASTLYNFFNPNMSRTLLHERVQKVIAAQSVLQDPSQHSPADVKQAKDLLEEVKQQRDSGVFSGLKDFAKQALKHPLKSASALAIGAVQDPEFFGIGGGAAGAADTARAAKMSADAAEAARLSANAQRFAETAGKPEYVARQARRAAAWERVSQSLGLRAKEAKRVARLKQVATSMAEGAGINTAVTQQQGLATKGYATPSELQGAAATGAGIGLGAHVMHSTGMTLWDEFRKRAQPSPKTTEAGPAPAQEAPKTPSGAPLHPDTPMHDEGKPPLTGGVDATGRHTHLHEGIPESMDMPNKDGETVSVPVKQAINYHEHIEFPLMHMEEPASENTIQELEHRIGRPLPELTKEKLRRGESLPYTNPDNPEDPGAHEIATWAENHMVETLYGVPGDKYQEALKGTIKDISKEAKKSPGESVPKNLDTKPYDDIGETDTLGGEGARPAVDSVAPGTPEGMDNEARGQSTRPVVANAKLPSELRGAKPTYYNGTRGFGLDFSNDFDKASYILRNPNKLSKRDADYMKWAQSVSGMTPEAIRAHGQRVASTIKGMTRSGVESGTRLKVPSHTQAGRVDSRLLALGAVAGAGGLAAGFLPARNARQRAAQMAAGALAGLFLGINHLGDSIEARGFGRKEVGSFAGPLSRLHSSEMEKTAREMEAAGKSAAAIKYKTGMYKGAGGHWHSEFSDKDAVVHEGALTTNTQLAKDARQGKGVPLSKVMDHANLEKAYPGLADKIHVRIKPGTGGAFYDPNTGHITIDSPSAFEKSGTETFKKVLLHEVGHAIAHYEGFPRGASPKHFADKLNEQALELNNHLGILKNDLTQAEREGNDRYVQTLTNEINEVESKLSTLTPDKIHKIAWEMYRRSAGENLAKATQDRADYSESDLRRAVSTKRPVHLQNTRYNEFPSPHRTGETSTLGTEPISAHELPISEELKKTGEMDDEGSLLAMQLPEDRLPNEDALIESAKGGDQRAMTVLFHKYYPGLVRAAQGYVRTMGPRLGIDAEDIANHAMTSALTHLDSFQGNSSFKTWLHNIMKNHSLNEIQRAGRTPNTVSMFDSSGANRLEGQGFDNRGSPISVNLDRTGAKSPNAPRVSEEIQGVPAEGDTPEEMEVARQTSSMVKYAISRLPPEIKEAITLKNFEGLSNEEIAQKQGVPLGTVKSRLHRGTSMLEESIKRGHGARYLREGGFINQDFLKRWALAIGGTTLGMSLAGQDHKLSGAIKGFIAGVALGSVTRAGMGAVIRAMRTADNYRGASVVLDGMEDSINIEQRHLNHLVDTIKQTVPDPSRREAISHYLEGDKSIKLSPAELQIAKQVRAHLNSVGLHALTVGVTKQLLPDYITHIYGKDAQTQAALDAYQIAQMTSAKQSSRFGLERKGPRTLAEAQAHGMKVETDIAKILQQYGTDMNHAIYGKTAISLLKKMDIGGQKLLLSDKTAPMSYVGNPHPALRGLRIHPAIAMEMSHLFDVYRPGIVAGIYDSLSNAVRRVKLSYSLFHAKTLFDITQGVHLNPLKNLKDSWKAAGGMTESHAAIKNPVRGDIVDQKIRAGLTGQFNTGAVSDVDIGSALEETLKNFGESLDKMLPGASIITDGLRLLDNKTQKITWDNMWTGLKATAEDSFYQTLRDNNARAASNDPTHRMPSDAELHTMAASVSNKLFGGLNYRRLANEVSNKYMRQLLMSSTSPAGMRAFRRMMLAPDFTFATTSHILGMFGKSDSFFKELLHPTTKAGLHRAWFIKSSLYYLVYGNILNHIFSGHYLWQNKDPFMIDLGDGRKMQWSKAITDPFRTAEHPFQEALNKENPLIQEAQEQVFNQKYLRAGGFAPPITKPSEGHEVQDRLAHLSELVNPIPVSNAHSGIIPTAMGFAGMPVYGEEKKKAKSAYEQELSRLQEGK